MKINSTGNKKWSKKIFQKKNYDSYGSDIKLSQNKIKISYSYKGYNRVKDSLVKDKANMITVLNNSGRILKETTTTKNEPLYLDNATINAIGEPNKKNELVIERDFKTLKTVVLPEQIKHYWLKKSLKTNDGHYLFGANDHNLGYLILTLDKKYNLIDYWQSETSNGEDATSLIIQSDGSLIVVGKKTDKTIKLPYGNATYINIIKLKNDI
jgi:hypothetical protein